LLEFALVKFAFDTLIKKISFLSFRR